MVALATLLLRIVEIIASRIDAADKAKLASAVMALQFIREANDAIAKAKAARAAAERDAATGGLPSTDRYRRD